MSHSRDNFIFFRQSVSTQNYLSNPALDGQFEATPPPVNWFRINTKVFKSLSDNKNVRGIALKHLCVITVCNTFRVTKWHCSQLSHEK